MSALVGITLVAVHALMLQVLTAATQTLQGKNPEFLSRPIIVALHSHNHDLTHQAAILFFALFLSSVHKEASKGHSYMLCICQWKREI